MEAAAGRNNGWLRGKKVLSATLRPGMGTSTDYDLPWSGPFLQKHRNSPKEGKVFVTAASVRKVKRNASEFAKGAVAERSVKNVFADTR